MRRLTDAQVDTIARRLADRLGGQAHLGGGAATVAGPTRSVATIPGPTAVSSSAPAVVGEGIFPTVDECIDAARTAFVRLGEQSLALRTEIIASIRKAMLALSLIHI